MKASRLIFVIIPTILFISIDRIVARDFTYIFTSKGTYETCEDLWFKCLILNDSTFHLSDKSHTAFVELVNPADSVVWKEKYPVINGECDGQIYIGDDWETGEYRMYVNTRNTLGSSDSVMFPKRLLIVKDLPEAQKFVSSTSCSTYTLESDTVFRQLNPLAVQIELDSVEYHTRSIVRAKFSVRDSNGNPVKAKISLSVYDRLYDYPAGNLGLLAHCHGMIKNGTRNNLDSLKIFLPDGPISGKLIAKKRKKGLSTEGQFINVFDFSNTLGSLNIVETGENGYFEVPLNMAAAFSWELLLKPISGQKMRPEIVFNDSFDLIDEVRKHSHDHYFTDIHLKDSVLDNLDSLDLTGRRIVRLREVEVKGQAGRYPNRTKLMGYLDSISTSYGNAWVCGCPAGNGTSFLNDYIPGYTHHPGNESYQPVKRSLPVKGKSYTIVKYTGGVYHTDHLVDIKIIEYTGPRYSDEELLRMDGMWKGKGFYPPHKFVIPDEEDWGYGLEDIRNTLLWETELSTDSHGEVSIEIKTSDITSSFILKGICWSFHNNCVGEFYKSFNVVPSH